MLPLYAVETTSRPGTSGHCPLPSASPAAPSETVPAHGGRIFGIKKWEQILKEKKQHHLKCVKTPKNGLITTCPRFHWLGPPRVAGLSRPRDPNGTCKQLKVLGQV